MERRVRERKWDSSFKCLMRRVRRSSGAPLWLRQAAGASTPAAARVAVFGVLQLGFTLGTLPLGIASYRWWQVGAGWQVIKLVATLYFGAQYTCTRMLGKEHED